MSNISYKEAVRQVKILGEVQRFIKRLKQNSVVEGRVKQENVRIRRKEINYLLSVIAAHKQARRLYGLLRECQDTLGVSTELRKKVDKVLG